MYVSGILPTFTNRMHQGANTTGAFAFYISEGNIYIGSGTGIISPQLSGQWEKEARLCSYRISGDVTQFNAQQFRLSLSFPPQADPIPDQPTGANNPIVYSWSSMGTGISGINVYFCRGTSSCSLSLTGTISGNITSYSVPVVSGENNYFRFQLGVVGDGVNYLPVERTGIIAVFLVTGGTGLSPT